MCIRDRPKSDIKRWFLSTPVMEATFSPYVDGIWRNLLVSALNTFKMCIRDRKNDADSGVSCIEYFG